MAMNVPTWANAGVSPSAEKKAEGYAAGECLPAQHLNWFLNQIFSNLSEAKPYIDKLETTPPVQVITGTYIGTGSGETIDIGVKPTAVVVIPVADLMSGKYPVACIDGCSSYQDAGGSITVLGTVSNGFFVGGNTSTNCSLCKSDRVYSYFALVNI